MSKAACPSFWGEEAHSLVSVWQVSSPSEPNVQIKTDFVQAGIDKMAECFIDEFNWRILANVTVAAGQSARGELVPQIIGQFNLRDGAGDRYVVEGASARLIAQGIYGNRYPDELDLGPGTFDIEHWLPIPIRPDNAHCKPQELRWYAPEFRDGYCSIGWNGVAIGRTVAGATNGYNINSASVQIFLTLVDEFDKKYTRPRLTWHDKPINNSEDEYVIGTDVRVYQLGMYYGSVNQNLPAGPTPWPASTITSTTWGNSQTLAQWFRQQYISRRHMHTTDTLGAAPSTDEAYRGLVIPLVTPREGQVMNECPHVAVNLNLKTSLPIGAGTFLVANRPRLVYGVYENIPANYGCGCPSSATLGGIVSANAAPGSPTIDPAGVASDLVKKLPREIIMPSAAAPGSAK